ncbi:MAG: hypothetical protein IJR13_07560 [Bacteroidales bacterium]|nr:hypothetical protein [Bacteroidales bacterium]
MFGTLRAGSLIYILNKGDNPSLAVGQVTAVTPPHPKMQNNFMPMPMQQEQVMDISVKVGDDVKTFSNVNANLSTVDTGAGGYTISEDKAAIVAAVEAFGTMSQNALNSMPYHQKVVASCKQMMLDLNPNLQKEAERDQEMTTMRNEMAEMRAAMGEMTNLLKGVFGGSANPITKKGKE